MTDAFSLTAEIDAAMRDRASAWQFVARFAEHWLDAPLDAGSGVESSRFDLAEADVGVHLPAALRELYELAGRRRDLWSNQDKLLPVGELYVDRGALIVRHENQLVARWGVLVEHLDLDDPPAVVLTTHADKALDRWEPWTGTFSAAAVQWLVYESCMRSGTGDLSSELRPRDLDDIVERGTPIRIPPLVPGPLTSEADFSWLLVDDVIVAEQAGTVLISGRSLEATQAFRDTYPADWLVE